MEKLQFEFAVVASTKDDKTNVIAITSIYTEEGKRYVLPAELRHIGYHKELMKTENYSKLKNTLKTRHQKRKVWIKMTKELKDTYIDEDQNLQFENQYLEEIDEERPEEKTQKDNLTKILEKLIESSKKKEEGKNLKQISEKFMIEKFTSKHPNAKQWIKTFEKECTRFDIIEDETKIEILRLFLDKSCSDWHCATLTKLTVEARWEEWKNRFLETFADKGWSTAKYALAFRYKEGSLTDYAIKKERLLLDMNKDIDSKTLTTLIAIGLPEFIINSRLIKIKGKKNDVNKIYLKSINGVGTTRGLITIKIKIFNIEEKMDVYIVEEENFQDFIIGLDMIKTFKLIQNEELQISQKKEIDNYNENKQCCVNFNEHIKEDEFEAILDHLDNLRKTKIKKLIEEYNVIFARDKYDIGTVTDYEARIDLIVDEYCSKRPYRCTIGDKKEIEEQVGRLLEKGLIEESYSPFAAPVTLAYKRDEGKKSRLCIDFRDLNKIIIPQAQPFPLINDLIIKTRNCRYFTTLDINSAFWSIPLRIEDRKKTGFVTQDGHFQWTCLPFGLKTSPAIFQRILSNILRKYNLKEFTENYIDDILIFSESFQEHIGHIKRVLKAIINEGFRLKLKKCTFAAKSVKYLGHIIENNTVRPMKDNLISIQNFPTPKTQKNIRQFLGKVNFYHEYIPKNSILLDPLHRLLRKNEKFTWAEDCERSFTEIKKLLCSQPVLEIFDQDLPIRIYTDASLEGIGAVLKQVQHNETEKPVAYFSKKLNETQKRKKAIYLECLAIKEAVKYWQHWLIGRRFEVYSDHKPLENMNIKTRTDEELGDLTYYLSQYDFRIKYVPGKDNAEADCLSRNPVLEPSDNTEEALKLVNLMEIEEIKIDQNKNRWIQKREAKLIKKDGIFYKKIRNKEKIILSEESSIKMIKKIHNEWCHIGIRQTINQIGPYYTARNLTENIKKICKTCKICIKNKSRGQGKYGLMSQLGPATRPFEIMSIDTIGGFGGLRSTKKYLHLLVDHFTRYAFIATSKTQNATDFIKLVKNVLETDKIETILTDQYPGINSKEFKQHLKENDVKLIFTAVNAPFSNGLNERLNQTLVNKIRCRIKEGKKKKAWTTVARECVERYNKTEHTVTGFAPKYLLDGTDTSILPEELKREKHQEDWMKDKELALERTIRSHDYNKKLFDKNRKHHEFNTGDMVYIENGNRLNRKKLDNLRIGPFEIIQKISNSIYEIKTNRKKSETSLFHVTKLIPTSGTDEDTDEED